MIKMADKRPHRSREARADETRAKILGAAERAFAGEGLAGARTDAIAAEAGVNKALLYYYFKSKEALYEAVIEEQLREFNHRAMAILEAPGAARELLLEVPEPALRLHQPAAPPRGPLPAIDDERRQGS